MTKYSSLKLHNRNIWKSDLSRSPFLIPLLQPFMTDSNELAWDYEGGKSASLHPPATAQITLSSAMVGLPANEADLFDA